MKVPNSRIELATTAEPTRYELAAVYLDAEKKRLVATDGHILAIVPAETDPEDKSGLLPLRAFKVAREAMKRVPRKLRSSLEKKADTRTRIQSGRKVLVRQPYLAEATVLARPEGKFPEYEKVLPKAAGAPDVCFDLRLLNRLVAAIGHSDDGLNCMVQLWIDKSLQPTARAILVAVGSDCQTELGIGALMPMRDGELTAERLLATLKPPKQALVSAAKAGEK